MVERNKLGSYRVVISTVLNLINSLNHAWEARPSTFTFNNFREYHDRHKSLRPPEKGLTYESPISKALRAHTKHPGKDSNFSMKIKQVSDSRNDEFNKSDDTTADIDGKSDGMDDSKLELATKKLVLKKFGVNLEEGFSLGVSSSKSKEKTRKKKKKIGKFN